jgi:hypothetical protein
VTKCSWAACRQTFKMSPGAAPLRFSRVRALSSAVFWRTRRSFSLPSSRAKRGISLPRQGMTFYLEATEGQPCRKRPQKIKPPKTPSSPVRPPAPVIPGGATRFSPPRRIMARRIAQSRVLSSPASLPSPTHHNHAKLPHYHGYGVGKYTMNTCALPRRHSHKCSGDCFPTRKAFHTLEGIVQDYIDNRRPCAKDWTLKGNHRDSTSNY